MSKIKKRILKENKMMAKVEKRNRKNGLTETQFSRMQIFELRFQILVNEKGSEATDTTKITTVVVRSELYC